MHNLKSKQPKTSAARPFANLPAWALFLFGTLTLTAAYFSVEIVIALFLHTQTPLTFVFGLLWSLIFASVAMLLPRKGGRIFFGITFFLLAGWGMAQIAYHDTFHKMMWFSSAMYAGEGAVFILDIILAIPLLWWPAVAVMIAIGILTIRFFPCAPKTRVLRFASAGAALLCAVSLTVLPNALFLQDNNNSLSNTEYYRHSSWRAAYQTMYNAQAVYSITGFYHLTYRDFWCNIIYPLTPSYKASLSGQASEVDEYFADREDHEDNEMTGIYEGKNVVYVLMEAMDDWMITPEDTPTLYRLMNEGINFTNFYTPGYGSARTLNSEFCMNTGIYLPTTARYLFDFVTNSFNQSIASQTVANGYSAEVFHYNTPEFYSRGIFEPVLGYHKYNSYGEYTSSKDALLDDCTLFEIPELSEIFFRDGQTFNTIITRSAHLGYTYNEVISNYALKKYPEYRNKYASEEEICARVKAKLVDDMFARLLSELESRGLLENTVIVAMTDHYTYGYNNEEELFAHSGVDHLMLLEKTPCFVWSADGPAMEVDKTLCTADLVPTVLNLLGIDSPYTYLGQDAFDPNYAGYAYFPDGSWIADGVIAYKDTSTGSYEILANENNIPITQEYLYEMEQRVTSFIQTSNLLLTSDYYKSVR